jgi:DNA-binding PadR family transcriptional regulator
MSKGLGAVQKKVICYVGMYPVSGVTYRHTRRMLDLSPQTLSRAIRTLQRDEYIKAQEQDWFEDGESDRYFFLTTKGMFAFADKC